MTFSLALIITFFHNEYARKICRQILYFIVTRRINMLRIWIYLSCFLHFLKLFLIIKVTCHHFNKLLKFRYIFCMAHIILLSRRYFLSLYTHPYDKKRILSFNFFNMIPLFCLQVLQFFPYIIHNKRKLLTT